MTDHDPAYVAQLVAHLNKVSQFRIPCPGHPYGHLADLLVERARDNDRWAITRDGEAWTGQKWDHRANLHRHEIYRWSRDEAIAEAERIAPIDTEMWRLEVARIRAAHEAEENGDAPA